MSRRGDESTLGHVERRSAGALLCVAAAALFGCAPAGDDAARHAATIDAFCIDCHNDVERTADLSFEALDIAHVGRDAEIWENVVRKLRAGMMPPPDGRRPDWATREALVEWLEGELDLAAPALVHGAPALRRLNRTEYAYAIRDLLDVDVDVASLLPPDDSAYGFDNVAGALGVSSALLERYLVAAATISRLAVGGETRFNEATYALPVDRTQDYHVPGLPFGTRGGTLIRHHFPASGEYEIAIELVRDYNGGLFGDTEGEELEVSIDGERVHVFDLATETTTGFIEHEPLRFRVPIAFGPHEVGVTFANKTYAAVQDAFQPYVRSTVSLFLQDRTLRPHLGSVTLAGPYDPGAVTDSPSRDRIFVCRPADAAEERPCAAEILSGLAYRAYRRPVADADLEVLMTFYDEGRAKGGFERGIEMAIRRMLASPNFVFRYEQAGQSGDSGERVLVDDFELASRLSFFLWSSIPDDALLELAAAGRLADPAELERQVTRMLADPRSQRFVQSFAGQWLYLRNLDNHTPALEEFPEFDDNLRQAFRTETELLVESIIREDRNVLDLLTADYTFVNERLARHYGIPDIRGSRFRRVTLPPDSPRRGLLGQGSILTVTSYATRTSPVIRGKWILENLLGMPPPEPPPNVSNFEEAPTVATDGELLSIRERLAAHLANPTCAGCHMVMDPIGLALETFDGIGRWRTHEHRVPIDASTELVDGTPIDGPASLRDALVGRYAGQFVSTLTEKLLTYALGRGLDYADMPVVRSIVREASAEDYRFSALVTAIVTSDPFLLRTPERSAPSPERLARRALETETRDSGG